jgi:uracil-DNA glycosylase family 4
MTSFEENLVKTSNLDDLWNAFLWQFSLGVDDFLQDHSLNWERDSEDWLKIVSILKQNNLSQKPLSVSLKLPSYPLYEEKNNHLDHTITSTHLFQNLQRQSEQSKITPPLMKDLLKPSVSLQNCNTLEELEQAIKNFDGCSLKQTARNTVVWDGNPLADLLFIGEGPGEQEDRLGKPFVGRSGKFLDKILSYIGLSRHTPQKETSFMMTNIVFWRPPANRVPSDIEILACAPFLEKLIELVNPKIIITVGGPATAHMLKTHSGIMRLRGKWHHIQLGNKTIPILPTFHPAYLLRSTKFKKQAWSDFRLLKRFLQDNKI